MTIERHYKMELNTKEMALNALVRTRNLSLEDAITEEFFKAVQEIEDLPARDILRMMRKEIEAEVRNEVFLILLGIEN